MNTVLVFNGTDYHFHIVTAKKNDQSANSGFELVYNYVFRKIQNPILDSELAGLALSIEEYFRITPERNNQALQIVALIIGAIVTLCVGFGVAYIVKSRN